MVLSEIIVIGVTLVAATFWYFKWKFSYWKRNGIQYVEPIFPYGNIKGLFSSTHICDIISRLYQEMKGHGSIGGVYVFHSPATLILDPKLIRNVLIKDFQSFMTRGMYYNKNDDPLSAHLFALDAGDWKALRSKISVTFTSGNMKYLFPTVRKVGDEFKEALEISLGSTDVIEIRDFLGRYTTDVIGTTAFGIDCNSLRDPEVMFRQMGRKVLKARSFRALRSLVTSVSMGFSRYIGMQVFESDIINFFKKVITDTVTNRENNQVERNDFIDLLIKLKHNANNSLSTNEIIGLAFGFFLGGFETSATLLTFTLYELALNKDIQSKARQEIKDVLKKYNGEFTYEAMMDMKYIDQILYESLRKYPPVVILLRKTTTSYPVPDTNYTIPAGRRVWIPAMAIHHDPEYYPDPEKFDPDRFSPDGIKARDPMTFLGFGDGPRNCIGSRFGQMEARVGLVAILRNFEILPSSKTQIPLVIDPKNLVLSPLGGTWLKIRKLDNPI